jgi:hypothetical protein
LFSKDLNFYRLISLIVVQIQLLNEIKQMNEPQDQQLNHNTSFQSNFSSPPSFRSSSEGYSSNEGAMPVEVVLGTPEPRHSSIVSAGSDGTAPEDRRMSISSTNSNVNSIPTPIRSPGATEMLRPSPRTQKPYSQGKATPRERWEEFHRRQLDANDSKRVLRATPRAANIGAELALHQLR